MSALMELLKNKKAALAANRRAKTVKPEDGRSRWRVLPSWRPAGAENAEQFWHDFGAHYIKDQTGELKAVYICTDKTFGKPCSICSTVKHAVDSTPDEEMKKLLKQAASSARILMNAVQIDGKNPGEVGILEVGPTLFEAMMNIILEWGVEVLDPQSGKDFVIERSGKGINTKYSVQIGAKSEPLSPDVMKKLHDLDAYVAQESEEMQARALANFRQVAGLLTAPSASSAPAKPALASMSIDDVADDADLRALEGTATPVAESAPAKAVTPAPAAAPAAAGDSELDALLAELG